MEMFSSEKGFVLWEMLFFPLLFLSITALCLPAAWDVSQESVLRMSVTELQSSIREAEIEAAHGSAEDVLPVPSYCYFTCFMDHGQIRYYTRRGTRQIRPKGRVSSSLMMQPAFVEIGFQKNGRGIRENLRFQVLTKDGKHAYEIIVAAATGRVRYEKIR